MWYRSDLHQYYYMSNSGAVLIGTPGSLSYQSWWSPTPGPTTTGGHVFSTDQTVVYGYVVPYNVTVNYINVRVTTADNTSNPYDLGIYASSGESVGNWRAQPCS